VLALLGIAVREPAEKNLLSCVQKFLQLRNGEQLGLIHADHHPRMIKHTSVQQKIPCLRFTSGWKYAARSGSQYAEQGSVSHNFFLAT
jgi:hypothetical protein